MKVQLQIDGVAATVWRHLPRQRPTDYKVKHHYTQPGMRGGRFVPRRLGPDGVSLEITSQQAGWEIWTESEKLLVWPKEPLTLEDIVCIAVSAGRITTKTGGSIPAETTRKPLTDAEYRIVQQERLIERHSTIAAGQSAGSPMSAQPSAKPLAAPEVNETLLWHVQQKIVDELDSKLKSAPSASLVFTRYCRDRMQLKKISENHHWSYRTLKARKRTLEAFMKDKFGLTLAAFFVDRSLFTAAERQLRDHHARHFSSQALERDCEERDF